MSAHSPSSHDDNDGRYKVPLRSTVSFSAQPHTKNSSAPPYYAHTCMLQVVSAPLLTPPMFREGVDAAPGGDDERVEEFLGSAGAPKPKLTSKQKNREDDTITDECTAHYEMG